jgi:hypothetical protein
MRGNEGLVSGSSSWLTGPRAAGGRPGPAAGARRGSATGGSGPDVIGPADSGLDGSWLDGSGLDDKGFDDKGFDDKGFDDKGFDDKGFDDKGFDDKGFGAMGPGGIEAAAACLDGAGGSCEPPPGAGGLNGTGAADIWTVPVIAAAVAADCFWPRTGRLPPDRLADLPSGRAAASAEPDPPRAAAAGAAGCAVVVSGLSEASSAQ